MRDNSLPQVLDALDVVLEQERTALINGNLDQINNLLTRKKTLIDQINAAEAFQTGNITKLREKVARNQALLSNALEGIRAVSRRIAALRRIRKSLDTYDSKGQKNIITTGNSPTLEKRA